MASGASGEGPGTDQLGETVRARLSEYAELCNAAGAKLAAGRYGPTDLVADWARWAGMVAQDAVTAASLLVEAMPDAPPRTDDPPPGGG
jgi:hypothetical protein